MSDIEKNENVFCGIVLRIIEGLLNQEKYMLLKKLAFRCEKKSRLLIVPVNPNDADALQRMVTAAAFFIDERAMESISYDSSYTVMLKKLCIALKYAVLNYKMVVKTPDGNEERDCSFSIVTPSAHIHVPQNLNDKKTERFIAAALTEAVNLFEKHESEYLIYYDSIYNKMISEHKDDYVRRKYFEG